MITEDYVSFEVAQLLKAKGFDEACTAVYEEKVLRINTLCDYHNSELSSYVCAPTHQSARKWLREVYNIDICAFPYRNDYILYSYNVEIYKAKEIYLTITDAKTYEESIEAALKYCLENLI